MNLIAYLRVSTDAQGDSGLGLDAQKHQIDAYAAQNGHHIVQWQADIASGARENREGFQAALDALREGEAQGLVVAKVDRLTRSVSHFARILEVSQKQGWALIVLDLGVDTNTPIGKAMASILAVFAQLERDFISERTSAAMQARLRQDPDAYRRPERSTPAGVRDRVRALRRKKMSYRAIAALLDAEGVPTAQGGKWGPSTVRVVGR